MNKGTKAKYIKRTQKDYTMAFKLKVVEEVESSVSGAKKKYGIQRRPYCNKLA